MTAFAAPRTPWSGYGAGLILSLAAHAGAAVLVLSLLHPSPVTDQPPPTSELRIETEAVQQSQAKAQTASGDKARASAATGALATQGAIPESQAKPAALPQTPVQPSVAPVPQAAETAPPPPVAALPVNAAPVKAVPPAPPTVTATSPAATPVAAETTSQGQPLTAQTASGEVVAPAFPSAPTLTAAPATGDQVTATLAWSSAGGTVDPVSLKAIQSFMQPGDVSAQSDDVHDGLAALLSSVPCARLQAEFNPETGSLDLRGHVPDAALKGPLLAALQAQLGTGIKVNDAMMILPRPQCGALSGIADLGLPQSQDQLTNPRLIGADAQARTFSYVAGQTMVLDMAAPDYDAYLYVDYFDAGGNVIHLAPNDSVPLKLRPAKSTLHVGAEDAGEPFLHITIGPPYGQEIAAAFAASSPLYDGTRPLSEPAGPYLEWLKGKVAEARAKDPGFKGEWVYFMVSTAAK